MSAQKVNGVNVVDPFLTNHNIEPRATKNFLDYHEKLSFELASSSHHNYNAPLEKETVRIIVCSSAFGNETGFERVRTNLILEEATVLPSTAKELKEPVEYILKHTVYLYITMFLRSDLET